MRCVSTVHRAASAQADGAYLHLGEDLDDAEDSKQANKVCVDRTPDLQLDHNRLDNRETDHKQVEQAPDVREELPEPVDEELENKLAGEKNRNDGVDMVYYLPCLRRLFRLELCVVYVEREDCDKNQCDKGLAGGRVVDCFQSLSAALNMTDSQCLVRDPLCLLNLMRYLVDPVLTLLL
eukprot:2812824-Rhodomonas_salina.2